MFLYLMINLFCSDLLDNYVKEKRWCDVVIGVGEVLRDARGVDVLVECYGCDTPTNLCTFSNRHVPGFPMQHVDWIRCTHCMGTVSTFRYIAKFDFLKKAVKGKRFPAVLTVSTFKALEVDMLQEI